MQWPRERNGVWWNSRRRQTVKGMCRWTLVCASRDVTSKVFPRKPPSRPSYLDRCVLALTSTHLT
ncbi:hypothetical protein E2C01_098809 [Portunus trituberculatus]|uniref:Uncharacterized protein n=1 Tax=Portunus trituberculatus TaxID=210409 RepID=A0A5B7K967_PORTR|nr:hypothetical protein [Portunus trituberculatus]